MAGGARQGGASENRRGEAGKARLGKPRYGKTGSGISWQACTRQEWLGMARQARTGETALPAMRHGGARLPLQESHNDDCPLAELAAALGVELVHG